MNDILISPAWAGDLEALAKEAGRVQAELGLRGGGPNARLLRHYQSMGCVGRRGGDFGKPGDAAWGRGIYGRRHVLETVSVRLMLDDGWKLSKIGQVMASMDDGHLEALIKSRGAAALAILAAPNAARTAMTALDPAAEALQLVQLFQGKGLHAISAASPVPIPQPAPSRPAPSKAMVEHQPAPWLRIQVDEAAMARASPGARDRALAEAAAVLASLSLPSPSKP